MTREARVTIDSIAAGGNGIARADGLVVFVPRTAPGDVAAIDYSVSGRLARGRVRELITPSPRRVEPPCVHYTRDRCGGCQLQHLAYDAQLVAKQGIVLDALTRIGKRRVDLPTAHASPEAWRYRSKLTLAMRRRNGRWIAGLHPYDAPDAVFALEDCPITEGRVVEVWRAILEAGDALPDAPRLRGAVRVDDEGASFVLEGGRRWPEMQEFGERVPALRAIWWRPERGERRLVLDRRNAQIPAASFAQINRAAAAEMHAHVVERTMAHAPRRVVDAYAGAGATARALAARGVSVTAIELDADATRWLGRHLPAGSRAVEARVEDVLEGELPADVVLLNPPRAGVHERVTRALEEARSAPRAIIYVSCDPATLARDLARLRRFRIASLVAFDLFPQTAHVETVCELVPEAA